MAAIAFDDPGTWLPLVEAALVHADSYAARLKHAGVDYAYGDCSGLDGVFARPELSAILARIELGLAGRALRLYHGCRLEEGADPRRTGLRPLQWPGSWERFWISHRAIPC